MAPTPEDLQHIATRTLAHYDSNAQAFWSGTRDHDVRQNVDALLAHILVSPPFDILDFGCGPGRDLMVFKALGHRVLGLDGSPQLAALARSHSGCEVLEQNFLSLDLPGQQFDGVFANASLFHVPSLVLPQVLPFVRGPDERLRIQGLLLLGCLGDGAEEAVPLLVEALGEKGDPWVRAAASAALGQLKSRATGAVDQVVDLMDPATVDLHVLRWLAGLGSAASNAVPRLEEIVASEYHESRFEALVALLSIRPDHESGLALIRQTVSDEGSPITRAQAAREELAAAWISSPRRPHPEVGSLLEPLARVEIRAWSPNNAMTRATRALERLAPERVVLLYRQALEGAGWVHAATGLLRLDRNDAEATRRLVEGMAGDSPEGMSAILGLREAGSSNTEAIRALQSVVQSRPPPEEHMGQLRVLNAAYALARIRYREWMESVGFDELDW